MLNSRIKPRRIKSRKGGKFIPLILFVAALLLIPFFVWSYYLEAVSRPNSDGSGSVEVVISPGESVSQIAGKLHDKGLINSEILFKIYVRLSGNSTSLQAGRFDVPADSSISELVEFLGRGGAFTLKLTFPEGWRREEMGRYIRERLSAVSGPSSSLGSAQGQNSADDFLKESQGLEGYLFPDTYVVDLDVSGSEIVSMMRNNFEKKISKLSFGELTRKEAVIIASIVEREVKYDQDRPIVAGILIKRWKNDWPLEADATVQYAAANEKCVMRNLECDSWWPGEILQRDLEIDSPYNTRKYAGLPPTPICNPGLSSLEAVANYKDSPYWYYISDSTGRIHYAETLEDHNRNIFKYL